MNRSFLGSRDARRDGLPIIAAYLAVSATFGVVADAAHWPFIDTLLCSALVYAGSTQFILLSAIPVMGPGPAALLGLVANLRHLAYGTAVAPYVATWGAKMQARFGFGLTDEVFALVSSRLGRSPMSPAYAVRLSGQSYAAWLVGTAVGAGVGVGLPSFLTTGIAFGVTALFVALLVGAIRGTQDGVAAVTGAAVALGMATAGHTGLGILAGVLGGATAGYAIPRLSRTRDARGREPHR